MKIKYFTNSMVLISGKNVSILCDPWITFDENSNLSDYLRYQIFWATSIEPITNNLDYMKRVIDNQIIKQFV